MAAPQVFTYYTPFLDWEIERMLRNARTEKERRQVLVDVRKQREGWEKFKAKGPWGTGTPHCPMTYRKRNRMHDEMKYTSDGKFSVTCGTVEIARSYVGDDGPEARILQGMPRMGTVKKIIEDCPEFAAYTRMDPNKVPKLFTGPDTK